MKPILLDNHPNDSRVLIREDGIVQTLSSRCGTGGGNLPMILDVVPIEGNGARPSHMGKGFGEEGDSMFTLNHVEVHSVAYGICSYDSNAMKSGNPNSGVYEAETSRTLDVRCAEPSCRQGGVIVVQEKQNDG